MLLPRPDGRVGLFEDLPLVIVDQQYRNIVKRRVPCDDLQILPYGSCPQIILSQRAITMGELTLSLPRS